MRKEQFETITKWQRDTFKISNPVTKISHLKEELDELLYDLEFDPKEKRLEYADCIILLMGSAESDGMTYEDICDAIDEKMEINYKRKWGTPKENGVVNHIE